MSQSSVRARARAMKSWKDWLRSARGPNKNTEIDRQVSQIRNLLTMLRKAIHLDGREECTSIDPARIASGRRATTAKLSRAVSRGQWTSSPERDRARLFVPWLRSCDGAIIYITSELANKRRDVGRGSVSQPPFSAGISSKRRVDANPLFRSVIRMVKRNVIIIE